VINGQPVISNITQPPNAVCELFNEKDLPVLLPEGLSF
jgi:hypothetical protein